VHDHPDMKRLAEERNLDRETALTMRRERDEAVARATRAGEYAARVTANYRRECEEVVRLVGVIARAHESERKAPPQTTTVRVDRRDAPDDVAEKFAAAINAIGFANVSLTEESEDHATYTIASAMAQEAEHQWPTMPVNTWARLMLGPMGVDVPIVKGDTVEQLAKMIASAMGQHERVER
jgi:hypothetical protein